MKWLTLLSVLTVTQASALELPVIRSLSGCLGKDDVQALAACLKPVLNPEAFPVPERLALHLLGYTRVENLRICVPTDYSRFPGFKGQGQFYCAELMGREKPNPFIFGTQKTGGIEMITDLRAYR